MNLDFAKGAWLYRSFVWANIRREFASKWRRTQLGPVWLVLQPLATILVFTVIFAEIMRPSMPEQNSRFAYSVYLCAGILSWQFFAESLARCVSVFIDYSYLLKKVAVPKIALPLIVFGSTAIQFAVGIALFLVFLAIIGAWPGNALFALLPLFAVQVAFSAGLGVFLASINVFYRDVQQAVTVVLQFWFWLTPIVYLPQSLPAPVWSAIQWNPLTPLIRGYQLVFLHGAFPQWGSLCYPLLLSLFLVVLAVFAFARLRDEIVDEL